MLALLAFEVTIYRHQEYFRVRNKLSPPAAKIIFHEVTRQHLDIGIVCFIKYFVNYFFYKFGLEVQSNISAKKMRWELVCIVHVTCVYLLVFLSDMPAAGGQRHWAAYGLLRHAPFLRLDCGHV